MDAKDLTAFTSISENGDVKSGLKNPLPLRINGTTFNQGSTKKRALLFYSYLPPWRIDIFNEIGKYYDLTIVFQNAETTGFTYDRELLLQKLKVKSIFLTKGFALGNKVFRTGITDLIKEHKPAVIFTHEYGPTSVWLALLVKSKWCNARLIVTTSDNLSMATSIGKVKQVFRKLVLMATDRLVVYSDPVKKFYGSKFSGLEVQVCPNIQNPETLLANRSELGEISNRFRTKYNLAGRQVLYTGRLEHVKGLDLLLKAFSDTLRDTHQLVIVGGGSQESNLKQLVAELNLDHKVIFPGFFSGPELYAWYTMADFFILPSRYEPFGAVVNEALVFGCPVLASKNIGALDYIEKDANGLVFDPENPEDFKTTLKRAGNLFGENFNPLKSNLMIRSFQEYVGSFYISASV